MGLKKPVSFSPLKQPNPNLESTFIHKFLAKANETTSRLTELRQEQNERAAALRKFQKMEEGKKPNDLSKLAKAKSMNTIRSKSTFRQGHQKAKIEYIKKRDQNKDIPSTLKKTLKRNKVFLYNIIFIFIIC
jgi:hypothetical protein